MADQVDRNPMDSDKAEQKKSFINEKRIKQNPVKKALKSILKSAAFGLSFGAAAILGAAALRPVALHFFPEPETEVQTTLSISLDETETVPTTQTMTETVAETDPVEDVVAAALKNYAYSIEDLEKMSAQIRGLYDALDEGIVSIQALKSGTDWFNNTLETSGECSGAVIADTDTEFLILAPLNEAPEADSIMVRFHNNLTGSAVIKRTDHLSGLCVLSVAKEGLAAELISEIRTLALGNSYQLQRGDIVLGIGSPNGYVYSSSYGTISYVAQNVSIEDGMTRLLYTEADSNIDEGTWFVNTDGEIIGWASNFDETKSIQTRIAGISDFKPVLERMMNAQAFAYLGISGKEITAEMKSTGVPGGLYVTACTQDSPAYSTGIQAGDIITALGENSIDSLAEYKKILEGLQAEETIQVKAMRGSKDGYKEIVFPVIVGVR